MEHYFITLYAKFPQLHFLDHLAQDPRRVFIIELALFTIVLALFYSRRERLFARFLLTTGSTSEHPRESARVEDREQVLTSQLNALDNRLKTLERGLASINHDMTALVEHLMTHPGEPLKIRTNPAPRETRQVAARRSLTS